MAHHGNDSIGRKPGQEGIQAMFHIVAIVLCIAAAAGAWGLAKDARQGRLG